MTAGAPIYRFSALDAAGAERHGDLIASSEREARTQLDRRGLLLLSMELRNSTARGRSRLSADDLATGFRILADLIESGLAVGPALATFETLAPPPWGRALPALRESVREGAALSTALRAAPVVIPTLLLGLIRAGEEGDGLAVALRRAAVHAERTAETLAAIRSALAYPAIVALAGVASSGLLLGVVLPRFAALLNDLGQSLPSSTQRLLAVAEIGRIALPVLLVAAAAAIAVFVWSGRDERAGRIRTRAILTLPIIGTLWRSMLDARVATSVGALLGSGVPVRHALRAAAEASGDAEISARLQRSIEAVVRGNALSVALEESAAVGAASVRMIRAGEHSGRVSEMCEHAAQLERARSERTIRALVRLLEPALILFFAVIVGFVAVALLQAVYAVRP